MSWDPTRTTRFSPATRRAILLAHPECQLQLPGCTTDSTEADHIISHAAARNLGWTDAEINHITNGQGVCGNCHRIKTQAEQTAGRRARQARGRRPPEPHPGLRPTQRPATAAVRKE